MRHFILSIELSCEMPLLNSPLYRSRGVLLYTLLFVLKIKQTLSRILGTLHWEYDPVNLVISNVMNHKNNIPPVPQIGCTGKIQSY